MRFQGSLGLIVKDLGTNSGLRMARTSVLSGAPNDNFRKLSVRKTIGGLEFSDHFLKDFLLACLS